MILPWVAPGCYNHSQAADLFRLLRNEKTVFCTTAGLLQEIWDHFCWAQRTIDEHGPGTLEFLRATALVSGSYRQNLFLDGYIRLRADGVVGTYDDYIRLIFPNGVISKSSFEDRLRRDGLRIYDFDSIDIRDEDMGRAISDIQSERERRRTFRSVRQVDAEAEVSILLKMLESRVHTVDGLAGLEHFYFVSQSRILERAHSVVTWTPEALYRYLSSFPDRETDPDILQQCMLNEYYYAGITFVDRGRYERFFGSIIDESKASYSRELAGYIGDRDKTYGERVTAAFESTPDLEKPFFVAQMGWHSAADALAREERAQQQVVALEEQVRKLVAEGSVARGARAKERRRQDVATARNRRNLKHVRKRKRQKKKRRRKRS